MRIKLLILSMAMAVTAQAAILPTTPAGVHCAATAEAAVARLLAGEQQRHDDEFNGILASSDTTGFRVVGVRFDAVAQRRWAVVSSCSEPTRPLRTVALPRTASVAAESRVVASPMLVRSGEAVTVIRETGDSHLELHGTANGSAVLHGEVKVRMPSFSNDAGSPAPTLRGIVIAAGVVEVQP